MMDDGEKSAYCNLVSSDPGSLNHRKRTVGSSWIVELTGSVVDEVHGPTEELTDEQVDENGQRSITNSFTKFLLTTWGDTD